MLIKKGYLRGEIFVIRGYVMKRNILFISMFLFLQSTIFSYNIHAKDLPAKSSDFEFINFDHKEKLILSKNKPAVLIVRFHPAESGVQHHVLSLYKGLLEKGFNVHLAVLKGTSLQQRLVDEKLPHYVISYNDNISAKDKFNLFYFATHQICKDLNIKIIHTHGVSFEFDVAKKVAKTLNLKVIQQYHYYKVPPAKCYNGADVLVLASPDICNILNKKRKNEKLDVGTIEFIPPICNDDKFLNFVPTLSKELFFKTNFGIKLNDSPLVSMVANFYKCKNHEGLLHALHNLIYKENIKVQCVLAGNASTQSRDKELKKLCSDLGLNDFVHFLGFVNDIPSLMFHSDIVILPSIGEAFSITILEAAFMHKAIILSKNAGAAGLVIKDNESGLLCDPKIFENISLKIKTLVQSTELRGKFGNSAFNHVMNNFSKSCVLDLYIDLYNRVFMLSN